MDFDKDLVIEYSEENPAPGVTEKVALVRSIKELYDKTLTEAIKLYEEHFEKNSES